MKKQERSITILISGILLSVAIAIVTYIWPQSLTLAVSLLIGLILSSITLNLDLRIKLEELEESINNKIGEMEEKAIENISDSKTTKELIIRSKDDPFIADLYRKLERERKELAIGRYQISTLAEVYHDDVRLIKQLSAGESLLSTCSVTRVSIEEAVKQINNPHYSAAMQEQLAAVKRGILARRIYVFKDRSFFDAPEVNNHLLKLSNDDLSIRILFSNTVSSFYTHIDFAVFGEKKVSIGRIDPDTGICGGTEVYPDPSIIRDYVNKFNILESISHKIQDLTA